MKYVNPTKYLITGNFFAMFVTVRKTQTPTLRNISMFAFQLSHFSPSELNLWERNVEGSVNFNALPDRPFWISELHTVPAVSSSPANLMVLELI